MTVKKYSLSIIICSFCLTIYSQTNRQIVEVFNKFQDGYTRRDTSSASKFANDLCANDIQILGTGEDEWIQGIPAAKTLFKNDWCIGLAWL